MNINYTTYFLLYGRIEVSKNTFQITTSFRVSEVRLNYAFTHLISSFGPPFSRALAAFKFLPPLRAFFPPLALWQNVRENIARVLRLYICTLTVVNWARSLI